MARIWSWSAFTGGSGTVTSVGLTAPSSVFQITGSPVGVSGVIGITFSVQNSNLVFASPGTGSTGFPSFRALVSADLPNPTNRTVTSSGNILSSDNQNIIYMNQAAAISLTMPTHAAGFRVMVKDISGIAQANNVTFVRASGSETFEGVAADKIFQTNYGEWTIYDDGTNYWLI